MDDLGAQLALMARLPRTFPAFFARYGRFTQAQLAAIPPLLDGANVVVAAPTAAGKTAAALAPLLERHCPPVRSPSALRMLYLTPTRALVNDLRARLALPLRSLGVSLGAKTHDDPFDADRPPDLLLATPESLDALLATSPRLLTTLRAVVIDELHLLDATPRGDQLRALLARVRRVRAYAAQVGDAPHPAVQYVALSATLNDPAGAAARYFPQPQVVAVGGARPIEAELIAADGDDVAALRHYLGGLRARGWRKVLAFCNSRAEVEAYAAALRHNSLFGAAVYVHYSNIAPQRRREIEQRFAADEAALCFASSTLELGIDIGSVDVALLIGAPGSAASFAQRAGRASRRTSSARVACLYRSPLERLVFETLLATGDKETRRQGDKETRRQGDKETAYSDAAASVLPLVCSPDLGSPGLPLSPFPGPPFRPAVAVQQIFSLLKQSPTAALRAGELAALFEGMLAPADLELIASQLHHAGYLAHGRPGEWRPGPRLNQLFDEQLRPQVDLSIHSNVQGSAGPLLEVRDQHSDQIVAHVDRLWLGSEIPTLEGRPVSVEWSDGAAVWVTRADAHDCGERPLFRAARQQLSYDLAQRLPQQLGLPAGAAPYVAAPGGWLWFHFVGECYGLALLDLLRPYASASASDAPGLALCLVNPPAALPALSESQVEHYLRENYRQYEAMLEFGPFQPMLPVALRRRSVVEQFDVPRFLAALTALQPCATPETLTDDLPLLLVR